MQSASVEAHGEEKGHPVLSCPLLRLCRFWCVVPGSPADVPAALPNYSPHRCELQPTALRPVISMLQQEEDEVFFQGLDSIVQWQSELLVCLPKASASPAFHDSNNPRRNSVAHCGPSLQANLHHWMFVLDQIDDRFEKLIRRNPWVLIDSAEQPPSKEEEDRVNGSLFRLLRFSCVLVHNCCNKTTYNSLEVRQS